MIPAHQDCRELLTLKLGSQIPIIPTSYADRPAAQASTSFSARTAKDGGNIDMTPTVTSSKAKSGQTPAAEAKDVIIGGVNDRPFGQRTATTRCALRDGESNF